MSNLNPDQFHEHLHEVPMSRDGRHYLRTSALDGAYLHEFEVRGADVERGWAQREPGDHPGNDPKVQAALEDSVRASGVQKPLRIGVHPGQDKVDYSVLDGSHRYLAAKRTGQPYVPVRLTW